MSDTPSDPRSLPPVEELLERIERAAEKGAERGTRAALLKDREERKAQGKKYKARSPEEVRELRDLIAVQVRKYKAVSITEIREIPKLAAKLKQSKAWLEFVSAHLIGKNAAEDGVVFTSFSSPVGHRKLFVLRHDWEHCSVETAVRERLGIQGKRAAEVVTQIRRNLARLSDEGGWTATVSCALCDPDKKKVTQQGG